MKIAVTGGSGFIGTATIAEAEIRGHDAWSFDRNDGNDIMGSLRGLDGADCVIHLAGLLGTHELFDTPEDAVVVNVVGSLRVMQWCLKNDATYIDISMPDVFPPIYTATKIAAQRLATALNHSRGLRVSHVRAFNAYGPGQKYGPGHPQKILPTFALAGWRNEPIPVWGDGSQGVDLIHTSDLAKILLVAAEKTHAEEMDNATIDAGSGTGISVEHLARYVLEVTGSTAGVDYLPMRDGEDPTWIFAIGEGWEYLKDEGGWRPQLDWMSIKDTIDWYKEKA